MRRLFTFLSLTLLLTCAKEDSQVPNTPPTQIVKQYTLTASAGDGGTVSGGGTFASGTQVSLTATPSSGYSFSGWSNGSTTNPLTVTLNSNTTITANFQVIVNSYTLTVSAGEGGSVSSEGGDYEEGTEVTITATPNEGYEFTGWSDGESSQSRVVTINSDISLSAEFYIKFYNYERYSAINETTNAFESQKYFYRYLTKPEYQQLSFYDVSEGGTFSTCIQGGGPADQGGCFGLTSYIFNGQKDTWGDFDNDGKLDLFITPWKQTPDGLFGNEKTIHVLISDYFTPNNRTYTFKYSDYITWNSTNSIGDFDNDGKLDVYVAQNNRHNNADYSGNVGGQNMAIPPSPGVIVFFDSQNQMIEVPIGPDRMDTHQSSSGDIDNDGDLDIIIFPWAVDGDKEISDSPKIVINNGGRNFETIELLDDYNSFVEQYPFAWNLLSYNLFDIDGDGYLDIIGGTKIAEKHASETEEYYQYWEEFAPHSLGFHNNRKPWILWGTSSTKYNSSNIMLLDKNIYNTLDTYSLIGNGFTDFDMDGDIDIILLLTIVDEVSNYRNYELALFENKGNRVFEDVTLDKIDGYLNTDPEKFGEFYEIAMIDKDNDGDFDIVPYANGNSLGQTAEEQFITNLYWENTGGQFVRREYNYD